MIRCDKNMYSGPDAPGTHWYQCRLLLMIPIAVNKNQHVTGQTILRDSLRMRGYDMDYVML